MPHKITESKFLATPEKGEVSALLVRPQNATHVLVLGHGASSNMRTPLLQTIADHLADEQIATFRYNFPYSENKRGRDPNPVCIATIRAAVKAAEAVRLAPDLPLFAGGRSFGGRMTSQAQAIEPLPNVRGLAFLGFPLHRAGKPGIERAEHLANITVPLLFVSGERDALAELDLLRPVVAGFGERATLHLVAHADHSFKVLKRTRHSSEDVFTEAARVVAEWSRQLD